MFTARALPAIRPAFHMVDGDYVVVRSDPGAPAVAGTWPGAGPVLAYQADAIDPLSRLGWSVVIIGASHQVTEPGQVTAYREALSAGITGPGDQIIAIHADMITGFRLAASAFPVISREGQAGRRLPVAGMPGRDELRVWRRHDHGRTGRTAPGTGT
jgi:hypothetical protein